MTPPEQDQATETRRTGAGYVANLGSPKELKEESVFGSLLSSVRDVFFPEKLPPLQLESKPIAVVDRMAVKRDPVSTGIAIVLHALVFLLIFFLGKKILTAPPSKPTVTALNMEVPPPVRAKPALKSMGGGGGAKGPTPVTQGHIPPPSQTPIVPPSQPPKIPPPIAIAPTVDIQKNMVTKSNLPDLGIPNAPNVGVKSLGNGSGGGLGSGNGAGVGPGSGGNIGGGIRQIGGGVSEPQLVYKTEADYSEEARKAKLQGEVVINCVIGADGRPTRLKVIRPLGLGLDEKAMESLRNWKFKPAMEGGKPVPVEINIAVNFQIF